MLYTRRKTWAPSTPNSSDDLEFEGFEGSKRTYYSGAEEILIEIEVDYSNIELLQQHLNGIKGALTSCSGMRKGGES